MQITRRFFLKSTGALAVYCAISPFDLLADTTNANVTAQIVKRGKTLVVIFLRGGADGLNLIVPFKDPAYYTLRKQLAIPLPGQENGAIDLDGFFGLHPRMKALEPLFASGQAVAAHAVGYAGNTRSHFEEQDTWETGVAGNTIHSDGWLNRHLATSEGHGPIRAISIGDKLPRILRGKATAYAVHGISELAPPQTLGDPNLVTAALEHAYKTDPNAHTDAARDLLAQSGKATLDGIQQLQALSKREYKPGVEYPKTELARRLSEVARLIKLDAGLEIAEIDYDGWDTHQNQGGGIQGPFGNLVQTLGDSLAAFCADLKERMNDVLVVTLSDFGRTAAENGTGGTDHGWANCMLAIGEPVAKAGKGSSRKVVTNWPGLGPEQLHEKRDLLHTTDFRDVLAEVVRVHLGNPNLEAILPGHQFKPVGLVG